MGKKLYRPILKEGDHLDKSRKNNNRVRGVSRDSNNKNPDIIEWEEVDVEDQSAQNVPTPSPEPEKRELTPEQQELAQIIGDALADIIIYEAERLNEAVVKPWWKNSVKPWIRERFEDIKCAVSGKKKIHPVEDNPSGDRYTDQATINEDAKNDEFLDQKFDSIRFDMSSDEAKQHAINLINHMLGVAYEIRVLSNTRIVNQSEDEKTRLENQAKAERLLAEKVANNINEYLSDETLKLSIPEQKQLFNLLGGGIRLNGEYVPVELDKVDKAIDSFEQKKNSVEGESKE